MQNDKRKLKAVIFDMDGTLMDNIPYHLDSWYELFRKYNIPFDQDGFHAQNHGTIDEMIRRFFGTNLSAKQAFELGQEKEQIYRDLYRDYIREVAGLTPLLEEINKRGIKVALATMGDKKNIDFVLDSLNIRRFFTAITGSDEVKKGKPSPEIFIRSLQKLKLENTSCMVVEDSTGGIISARAAGIPVVGITTSHPENILLAEGCFRVIADFRTFDWLEN